MAFKDYFSRQAPSYARHRPQYPPELFDWLVSVAPSRSRAWDCATGNGQAALGLACHFHRVVATDPSKEQLRNAFPGERVSYCVCTAEKPCIASESIDLVTVAQALHWFDIQAFFAEVHRVLVSGGVVAAWAYNRSQVSPGVDEILDHFYFDTVDPYKPGEFALIDSRYQPVVMPFRELQTPDFSIRVQWSAGDMLAYIRTWSPVRRYIEAVGSDPVALIEPALARAWGNGARAVVWPLYLRAGVNDA